jgi:hypothetical protein
MHAHPPYQLSDVQKPVPGTGPAENDLGRQKKLFKGSRKNFYHSPRQSAKGALEQQF